MIKKEIRSFGKLQDGREASLYTLSSENITVRISDYGATVVAIMLKSPCSGEYKDVVLGFDSIGEYERDSSCFGSVCGRFANRIKNGHFKLDANEYSLSINNNGNHLHGGFEGFHKKLWKAEFSSNDSLSLSYVSPDMEEGYPGKLEAQVTYSIIDDSSLSIEYKAISDRDTIVNLTNHSYFNLSGHNSGNILSHSLILNSGSYTRIDETGCPDGEILPVTDTPFDFRNPHLIGERINHSHPQLIAGHGYDHNFIIEIENSKSSVQGLPLAATLIENSSNRCKTSLVMSVYTDKPGIQLYTGNFIPSGICGKSGAKYGPRHGVCLETQHFPDSINHPHFPSPVLRAFQKYSFRTIYQFSHIER